MSPSVGWSSTVPYPCAVDLYDVGEVSRGVSTEDSTVHVPIGTPTPKLADYVPGCFTADGLAMNRRSSAEQSRSLNCQISNASSFNKRPTRRGSLEELTGIRARTWIPNSPVHASVHCALGSKGSYSPPKLLSPPPPRPAPQLYQSSVGSALLPTGVHASSKTSKCVMPTEDLSANSNGTSLPLRTPGRLRSTSSRNVVSPQEPSSNLYATALNIAASSISVVLTQDQSANLNGTSLAVRTPGRLRSTSSRNVVSPQELTVSLDGTSPKSTASRLRSTSSRNVESPEELSSNLYATSLNSTASSVSVVLTQDQSANSYGTSLPLRTPGGLRSTSSRNVLNIAASRRKTSYRNVISAQDLAATLNSMALNSAASRRKSTSSRSVVSPQELTPNLYGTSPNSTASRLRSTSSRNVVSTQDLEANLNGRSPPLRTSDRRRSTSSRDVMATQDMAANSISILSNGTTSSRNSMSTQDMAANLISMFTNGTTSSRNLMSTQDQSANSGAMSLNGSVIRRKSTSSRNLMSTQDLAANLISMLTNGTTSSRNVMSTQDQSPNSGAMSLNGSVIRRKSTSSRNLVPTKHLAVNSISMSLGSNIMSSTSRSMLRPVTMSDLTTMCGPMPWQPVVQHGCMAGGGALPSLAVTGLPLGRLTTLHGSDASRYPCGLVNVGVEEVEERHTGNRVSLPPVKVVAEPMESGKGSLDQEDEDEEEQRTQKKKKTSLLSKFKRTLKKMVS
eukprot:gene17556-23879_t